MKDAIPDSTEERKDLLLATLVNPEAYFWLGLVLFGAVAAGWFLIGVGVFLALIPFLSLTALWALRKLRSKENGPSNPQHSGRLTAPLNRYAGHLLEVKLNRPEYLKIFQKTLAVLAVLFGTMTIFAGSRVLVGTNPGYVVFFPLLVFNTLMGFVYVGVGAISWRSLNLGKIGAFAIFALNLVVLAAVGIAYTSGGDVAIDSLRAMTLRTVVWLAIFSGLWWLGRRNTDTAPHA